MLVVKVELWPFGNEESKRTLGTMRISNDATGTTTRGNYNVRVFSRDGRETHKVRVENYPRKALSVWALVYQALVHCSFRKNL